MSLITATLSPISGFDPEAMDSLRDLERLPLHTPALIRANDLKSEAAESLKQCEIEMSGGERLTFHIRREYSSHNVAARWRAMRWWRLDIGAPAVIVESAWVDSMSHLIRDRVLRKKRLPASAMSPANFGGLIGRIRAFRPRIIFGDPFTLAQIARYAQAESLRLNDLGIRVAFVSSPRLDEAQGHEISAVFDCAVVNSYRRCDTGYIAHECNCGGMHVNGEDIVIEIIDAEGRVQPAGVPGEIVVTHNGNARVSVDPLSHR